MYIDIETVKAAAALITAFGTIFGLIVAIYKFYARQRKQDEELAAIRAELQIVCYGLRGALQGLIEQGCNGPCKDGLNHLEKHLNKQAHKGGDAA